jgi:hypothetical protein
MNIPLELPLHQFQGSYWFKFLSLKRKRRKRLWVFQTITQLTGGGRTIFQIVMRLNWGRQEKNLTQFQQLILIVMTKKETDIRRYKSRYYYKSLCTKYSLYFTAHAEIGSTATFSQPGGLISQKAPVPAFSCCPPKYLVDLINITCILLCIDHFYSIPFFTEPVGVNMNAVTSLSLLDQLTDDSNDGRASGEQLAVILADAQSCKEILALHGREAQHLIDLLQAVCVRNTT